MQKGRLSLALQSKGTFKLSINKLSHLFMATLAQVRGSKAELIRRSVVSWLINQILYMLKTCTALNPIAGAY